MTRLIDADALNREIDKAECFSRDPYVMYMSECIANAPTVDAVPISFIEKRIEQLKSHADYEFEANGGYAGGSQYRQWELECLLDAWAERKEE